MNKYVYILPFYPLFQMLKMQLKYGWISITKWQLILIWIVKLVVLEPFRIVEALVMAILPEKKVQPIFILGFYRSGTTYLQELLSIDKNHRTLTVFQSLLPEVSLCFGWIFIPFLTLITTIFKLKNSFHNIPYRWDFPGEEDVAINALMLLHDYNKIYQYPSHREEFTNRFLKFKNPDDASRWICNYKYLIKKLAYIYFNKQLVLKSPPNMGRILLLKQIFPDARFIFIHRDPYQCLPSAKRLWQLNKIFSFENYDDDQAEKIIIEQFQTMYELFKNQSKNIDHSVVSFDALIKDGNIIMRMLYQQLNLSTFEMAKEDILSVIEKRKRHGTKETTQHLSSYLLESHRVKAIRNELGYH